MARKPPPKPPTDDERELRDQTNFLAEWLNEARLRPGDVVDYTEADKSLVSRWLANKATPSREYRKKLAELFKAPSEDAVLKRPAEAWIIELVKDLSPDEAIRARRMLEAAFPKK